MRDFDVSRYASVTDETARQFKLGGHTFTFRQHASPDLYAAMWSADSDATFLKAADAFMENMLVGEFDLDAWAKARSPENEHPLSITEIIDITDYVLEVATGRPPKPSVGSSTTQSPRGTSSTEQSLSPAA